MIDSAAVPPKYTGINLGGLKVDTVVSESIRDPLAQPPTRPLVPPAVVFRPSVSPTFSDTGPIPLAGAGLEWPEGSTTGSSGEQGARLPLVHLWDRLMSSDSTLPGLGMRAGAGLALAASSALETAHATSDARSGGGACIVIPNSLSETGQQELIDDCRKVGLLDTTLLWRPVAAAFGWLDIFAREIRTDVHTETPFGGLLTVHLGVDGFEAAWLELILRPDSGDWVLPARQRPEGEQALPSIGCEWINAAARLALGGVDEDELSKTIWRSIWASPLASSLLRGTRDNLSPEFWGVPPSFSHDFCSALNRVAESVLGLRPQSGHKGEQMSGRLRGELNGIGGSLQAWIDNLAASRTGMFSGEPVGIVVTGELAALPFRGQTLGEFVAKRISSTREGRLLVEGHADCSQGLLARSAADYAARRAAQRPTYLDTLPQIEVLLEERGKPIWKSLLNDGEQYVDGGRVWRREPDLEPLTVSAHSAELSLKLWVEPEDNVRQAAFKFAEPPSHRIPVKLRAAMEPACGRARVEVLPCVEGALGWRSVLLEWERAIDLGKSRAEISREYPRKCPEIQPRAAAPEGWNLLESALGHFIARQPDLLGVQAEQWESQYSALRETLRTPPAQGNVPPGTGHTGIRFSRIVDSEGCLHSADSAKQERLDSVLATMAKIQRNRLEAGQSIIGSLIACLGYACASGEDVDFIADWVLAHAGELGRDHSAFLGGCLRDAKRISLFVSRTLERMEGGWTRLNDVMKDLGFILQWREGALDRVTEDIARRMSFQAQQLIARAGAPDLIQGKRPAPRTQFAFIERNSLVLLAFLLRMRLRFDSYLSAADEETLRLLGVLEATHLELTSLRLNAIGGSIKSDVLLGRVIDYVKREGTGTIIAE